jgi:hypothetical protein
MSKQLPLFPEDEDRDLPTSEDWQGMAWVALWVSVLFLLMAIGYGLWVYGRYS